MEIIVEKEQIIVEDIIYEIRGVKVMLDSDLAKLYQVETKRVNEAVKNNPEKFPTRFSFVLDDYEKEYLCTKFSTANISSKSRFNPRVFTEQGVYMLATILKSKVATKVSIAIMDTFVKIRHCINYNKSFLPQEFTLLEKKVDKNTKRINELFDKFDSKEGIRDYIFFEGEFYDAYSVLIGILNRAKKEIIIIDNYASKELLDMLRKVDKKITIVSKNIDETLKKKYESQYKNTSFLYNDSFHDRFIILDRRELYSSGASFKDIGKKCFAINEYNNKEFLFQILNL